MRKNSKKLDQPQQLLQWFIKCRLKNGLEKCYPISPKEKDLLWKNLPNICEGKGIEFFEFDSTAHRILIQASQLMFFQFLFEPLYMAEPRVFRRDEEEEDAEAYAVKIYFSGDPNPQTFYADVDVPNPKDEGDQGEMNNFLYYALHVCDEEEWLHFMDEDGEIAFFRGASIALAEIPLKVLCGEEDISNNPYIQQEIQTSTIH